jgi:uncharacterized protein (DUF58 family)
MMRDVWHRIREVLFEDGMRQQITRLGLIFTITVVLVGVAAFVSANNLLFLLLAALLSTFLISGFVSRLGLAGLELDLIVPEHVPARRKISARLVLTNRKMFTPSFSLHLSGSLNTGLQQEIYIPVIPARATLNEPVELFFERRGVYKDNTFRFATRFPFGFTHRRAHLRLEKEVLVYPSIDPRPGTAAILVELTGEIESTQRGRGSDFYRIRPYQALESARHVDWRATAHTGELQVREFAREQDQAVTVFLDLDVPAEYNAWFEIAVESCAWLCWTLIERGARFHFLTQKMEKRVPEEATVYDILKYLALVEPLPGASPLLPHGRNLDIAITTRPRRLAEEGWAASRMLGPGNLIDDGTAGFAGPGAAADVDHGRGADRDRDAGFRQRP